MLNIFKYFKTHSKLNRQLNDANNRIFNLNNKLLKQSRVQAAESIKLTKRISDQRRHINNLDKKVRRTQAREKQLVNEKEKLKDRIFGKRSRIKSFPPILNNSLFLIKGEPHV